MFTMPFVGALGISLLIFASFSLIGLVSFLLFVPFRIPALGIFPFVAHILYFMVFGSGKPLNTMKPNNFSWTSWRLCL